MIFEVEKEEKAPSETKTEEDLRRKVEANPVLLKTTPAELNDWKNK